MSRPQDGSEPVLSGLGVQRGEGAGRLAEWPPGLGGQGGGGAEPAQPMQGGGSPLLERLRSLAFISVASEDDKSTLKSRQSQ